MVEELQLTGNYTTDQLEKLFNIKSIKRILNNTSWANEEWAQLSLEVEKQKSLNRKLPKLNRLKLTFKIAETMRELRYQKGLSIKKISGIVGICEASAKLFFRGLHSYYPKEGINMGKVNARFKNPIKLQ